MKPSILRLRRAIERPLAATLALALVTLSPGIEAHRAFAQRVEAPLARPVVSSPVSVIVAPGMQPVAPGLQAATLSLGLPAPAAPIVAAQMAQTLAAPAGIAAAAAPAGSVAAAAGRVASSAKAATVASAARPAAAALAKRSGSIARVVTAAGPVAQASGESANGVSERVFAALIGGNVGSLTDSVAPAAQETPSKPLGLERPASSPAPSAQPAAAAPTRASQAPARGSEAASYGVSRRVLRSLATTFGLAFSLPVAGPALAQRLLDEASSKRVVFSDYDDTLDKFASIASPETVASISGVLKAGKTVVVITDRPDSKKPGSKNVTILESLESIPAADRAGLWVSANKGGRIFRYDEKGQAQLVKEEPALAPEVAAKTKEAAEALKARLSAMGAEQHDGSKNVPAENPSPYGYSVMLKVGTPEAVVKAVARAFQEELASRGVDYEVEPRLAKDPAFPPYVTFSKLDKSLAVLRVSELIGVKAADAVILGDSMYAPKPSEPAGWRARLVKSARALGERLSGQPALLTGNGTDRDMEKGLPGALTLSVGGTADPALRNGYVMPGKGPAVTRAILDAMAAGRRSAPAEADTDIPRWIGIPALGSVWAVPQRDLPDPNAVYADAYKAAAKRAEGKPIRLVQASGSMPVQGGGWNFTFAVGDVPGATVADQIAVDVTRGILGSGGYETRERFYSQAPLPAAAPAFVVEPYLLSMGVKVTPASAMNEVLRQSGSAKGGWSVALRMEEESMSGDRDYWYHFYGADRHVAVNARTGAYRAYELPESRESGSRSMWDRVFRAVSEWAQPYLANWTKGGMGGWGNLERARHAPRWH